MKKICHVIDSLAIGGLERTVLDIAAHVRGYEHHVWCLKERGAWAAALEKADIPIEVFGFEGSLRPRPLSVLAQKMKAGRFSIVHAHGHYPSQWGRAAAFWAGVPIRIVHEQTVYHDLRLKERLKLSALSYGTTAFIAVSDAVRKSVMKEFGVPEARITVVYNSAGDMRSSPAERAEARAALGIGAGPVIGSVGRLEQYKGYAVLIDAVRQMALRGLKCTCLLAGDGPDRKRLERIAGAYGVTDRIRFLGMRDDIARVLAALDVFIQPSTVREGLPLVLAEAASAGLPSVVTAVGGNPEIVLDGRSGFVVPPNDAPALAAKAGELLADAALRARMGAAARDVWQERFTLAEMCAAVKRLYDRLAQEA